MPSMRAWNGWYHVNGNTYGTWLRGDPRGWRARHHREHVEGDYRHPPPPGDYEAPLACSRRLMERPAVQLARGIRQFACRSMARSMLDHAVEVIAVCVDDHHYHLLARFPPPSSFESGAFAPWAARRDDNVFLAIARHFVGIAKKDSARLLSDAEIITPGGVWGKRCHVLAIRDRQHQLNVFDYIVKHGPRGAAVWTFRVGVPSVGAHGLRSVGLTEPPTLRGSM